MGVVPVVYGCWFVVDGFYIVTREIDNALILEGEEEDECEMCGLVRELRPYGPNGENVCIECMMKNEKAAEKVFAKILRGELN